MFLSRLGQQLGKTQLLPIGIGQMQIPLPPRAILRRGRGATSREHGLIERIDIVNAKDCAAPPGREIARREGQIDESMPSLDGTEARLWPAIDQREAEFAVESNGLGHGPYSKGHGTDVVNHRHCVHSCEQLYVSPRSRTGYPAVRTTPLSTPFSFTCSCPYDTSQPMLARSFGCLSE